MGTAERAKSVVLDALDALNEDKATDEQINFTDDLILMGPDSILDSLDLINLIIFLEERLNEMTDKPVQLAIDPASFEGNHPFQTTATLVQFITNLLIAEPRQNG